MFTKGSLEQLHSLGFHVLYFPYDTLVAAFATVGIKASFDETTPDAEFQKCGREIESASNAKMQKIKSHLVNANKDNINEFIAALGRRLDRMVERVVVIPLYGRSNEFNTVDDAVRFLDQHSTSERSNGFQKYEVLVAFSNGDRVEGSFRDKVKAIAFLQFVAKQ